MLVALLLFFGALTWGTWRVIASQRDAWIFLLGMAILVPVTLGTLLVFHILRVRHWQRQPSFVEWKEGSRRIEESNVPELIGHEIAEFTLSGTGKAVLKNGEYACEVSLDVYCLTGPAATKCYSVAHLKYGTLEKRRVGSLAALISKETGVPCCVRLESRQ